MNDEHETTQCPLCNGENHEDSFAGYIGAVKAYICRHCKAVYLIDLTDNQPETE